MVKLKHWKNRETTLTRNGEVYTGKVIKMDSLGPNNYSQKFRRRYYFQHGNSTFFPIGGKKNKVIYEKNAGINGEGGLVLKTL